MRHPRRCRLVLLQDVLKLQLAAASPWQEQKVPSSQLWQEELHAAVGLLALARAPHQGDQAY